MTGTEANKSEKIDWEIYCKLRDAEQEAERTDIRYSSKEVLKAMQKVIEAE